MTEKRETEIRESIESAISRGHFTYADIETEDEFASAVSQMFDEDEAAAIAREVWRGLDKNEG